MIFSYAGYQYPDYLKSGNACKFIIPAAQHFCRGSGLDVGAGKWPLPGATPVDLTDSSSANNLPAGTYDYIFSSHCLEHVPNPIAALEHWQSRLVPGGVVFLYLPHPDMVYWRPEHCRKHLHSWKPEQMREIFWELGFRDVINSERDMMWSFAVVGFKRKI